MEVLKTLSLAVSYFRSPDKLRNTEPATAIVAMPDKSNLQIIPLKEACVDINNLNGNNPNSFIPQCKRCAFRGEDGAGTNDPGGPAYCTGLKWSELLSVHPRATLYRFSENNDWDRFVTYLPCKPRLQYESSPVK